MEDKNEQIQKKIHASNFTITVLPFRWKVADDSSQVKYLKLFRADTYMLCYPGPLDRQSKGVTLMQCIVYSLFHYCASSKDNNDFFSSPEYILRARDKGNTVCCLFLYLTKALDAVIIIYCCRNLNTTASGDTT